MFLLVSTGAGIKSCLAVIVCLTLKVGLTMSSINTVVRLCSYEYCVVFNALRSCLVVDLNKKFQKL